MPIQPIVYLLDDDSGLRESLRWLFESHSLAVQEFATPQDLLCGYDPSRPGCMGLDLQLPGMSGLDVYDKLCEMGCEHPFVVITGFGDVPTTVRAMKSGAVDFIEKPFNDKRLLSCVHDAIESDDRHRLHQQEVDEIHARIHTLSPRERQVMELVAEGRLTKQIAAKLGVTIKTVEVHRSNLTKKMGVRSVVQLVNLLNRLSLIAAAAG